MTAQLLPELGKLLSHPDDPIVLEATKLFLELSKKDASCRAIIGNGNIVSTLIQAMGSTMSAEIQKMAAGTLHNLSNDRYTTTIHYYCTVTKELSLTARNFRKLIDSSQNDLSNGVLIYRYKLCD